MQGAGIQHDGVHSKARPHSSATKTRASGGTGDTRTGRPDMCIYCAFLTPLHRTPYAHMRHHIRKWAHAVRVKHVLSAIRPLLQRACSGAVGKWLYAPPAQEESPGLT